MRYGRRSRRVDDKSVIQHVPGPDLSAFIGWGRSSLISRARLDASCVLACKAEPTCLAAVKLNGRWGFIDMAGSFVVEPTYCEVRLFSSEMAPFSSTPVVVHLWDSLPEAYIGRADKFSLFGDGCSVTQDTRGWFAGMGNGYSGGHWGYLDFRGKVVIPPLFESVRPFHGELEG